MSRSNFALFVALLIHFIFLLLFWLLGTIEFEKKPQKEQEKKIKISLKELPKKYKKSGLTKEKIPEPKIAPPMPKGSQLKKLLKEPPVKFKPKQKPKKPKLNKPTIKKPQEKKPKPIVKKIEPLPPEKPYIPLLSETNTTKILKKEDKKKKETKSLYDMLSQDNSANEKEDKKKKIKNSSSIANNIKELYGEEFGKLSPGQQKYILDNQEIMRRITQQVLNRVARVNLPNDLNVNRTNVIEFYLHPNGDISDFKFLKKSGYYILDDTTKETIEYAYSRYPRPSEKTLIRYNVFYNLARY
ncbi:energy transducer TonB [Sulfurimonas lithotrophica]|uniref:Energy transducer TonB n=1 Tax=Sulfurimonas lithotrophica TaxID=2590022 RepID=A0A5P8P0L2_9BACT|nr:energy transducer TonB [Sulfurimonas lithotrophica]QFR49245.1 energy transducer TonB [Sulfurimonas lithotrophica]